MKYLLGFLFFLCACGKPAPQSDLDAWAQESLKLRVLSTTAMIDDLVRQIGKERIAPITLIQGEIDPHSYELVKGDEEKFSLASVVFYNGLGLEHGASLRYRLQHHAHAVNLGEKIERAQPGSILHLGSQVDPHIWMDVKLWMEAITPIAEQLAQLDPAGKEEYEKNAAQLRDEMGKVHQSIAEQCKQVPSEKRYLVSSHSAFNYFVRSYLHEGDETVLRSSAPEGLAPDGQLAAAQLQQVMQYLIEHDVHVLFTESNVSRDALRKIASCSLEKGHLVSIAERPLYCDAMGGKGSGAETYLDMMQYNARVLVEAWNDPQQH